MSNNKIIKDEIITDKIINDEISKDEIIIINKYSNNTLQYLPKIKSNFDLISNFSFDIKEILYNGCQYIPNLLCNNNDLSLFNKLNDELLVECDKIVDWSKHHKIDNPTDSKTFNNIVKCLEKYFNISVLATRLNYYTEIDYKPFHHDSHTYSNGLKEDTTIGLSLGGSRSLAFKHVESEQVFYFPQNNGDVFCFDYMTNKKFMHGIPKLKNHNSNKRLSVILWGKNTSK